MDGDCGNAAEQEEVEGSADVPVSDAGADEVRRDHLMQSYHRSQQAMEKVYRNARKEYEEDHDLVKFEAIEEAFYSGVKMLDEKFPGMY